MKKSFLLSLIPRKIQQENKIKRELLEIYKKESIVTKNNSILLKIVYIIILTQKRAIVSLLFFINKRLSFILF